MFDPLNIPEITNDEMLTRFMLNSNNFRTLDGRPHHSLFMPYRYVELSVNRLRDATEHETWTAGKNVARKRHQTLYGRSDIFAGHCLIADLRLVCDALRANKRSTPKMWTTQTMQTSVDIRPTRKIKRQ